MQTVVEALALQVFHHQKIDSVLMADVMQGTDVGMVQRRNHPRFAIETVLGLRVVGKMGRQNLDGNGAVKAGVAGTVDFSHSASAKGSEDFVRSELRAGGEGHQCTPLYSQERARLWFAGVHASL